MRKDRTCLRCSGIFSSPGNHIRICNNCHHREVQYQYHEQNIKNWEGYNKSFLPDFNKNKDKRVKGRWDFCA